MPNLVLSKAYVPTQANMEAFRKDDLLVESDEVEGEEVDINDILSMISSMKKFWGDILTLLWSLNDQFNAVVTKNPIESTRRCVQFATDKIVEPRTPHAVAQVEKETDLLQANLLKDLKPPRFGGEEKERNKDSVNMFLHKWGEYSQPQKEPWGSETDWG